MKNTRGLMMMVVALVLALGAVVAAAGWISKQASGNTQKVAVALVDIPLGSRMTPEMVRMADFPNSAVPPGAMTEAKLVDSRVARTTIQRGEAIMESKLAPAGTQGGLSAVVASGKRAMTVRVNDVVGVAGFALPGNFVDVLVNTQEEGASNSTNRRDASISKIVLERILVLAIAQEASRDDTKPKVVNAVTLELSPEQTEKLDLARSVGTLSLVLRNQIDPEPVNTEGATKSALLGAPLPLAKPETAVAAAPKPRPRAVKPRVELVAAPREQIDVIKGLDRSTQQF